MLSAQTLFLILLEATQDTDACVCPFLPALKGLARSAVDVPVTTASPTVITAASPTKKKDQNENNTKHLIRAAECQRPALTCRM